MKRGHAIKKRYFELKKVRRKNTVKEFVKKKRGKKVTFDLENIQFNEYPSLNSVHCNSKREPRSILKKNTSSLFVDVIDGGKNISNDTDDTKTLTQNANLNDLTFRVDPEISNALRKSLCKKVKIVHVDFEKPNLEAKRLMSDSEKLNRAKFLKTMTNDAKFDTSFNKR